MGDRKVEQVERVQEEDEEDLQRRQQALRKLLAIRNKPDKSPCKVLSKIYIGGIGAASNLKRLQSSGIVAVLCVSAVVPRFYPGELQYKVIPVYDDASQDILTHIPTSNKFIRQGIQAGGVLIHCYAGQSRSVAFLLAFLMGERQMGLPEAWDLVKTVRPSAHPNSGFVRQLSMYAQQQNLDGTIPSDMMAAH